MMLSRNLFIFGLILTLLSSAQADDTNTTSQVIFDTDIRWNNNLNSVCSSPCTSVEGWTHASGELVKNISGTYGENNFDLNLQLRRCSGDGLIFSRLGNEYTVVRVWDPSGTLKVVANVGNGYLSIISFTTSADLITIELDANIGTFYAPGYIVGVRINNFFSEGRIATNYHYLPSDMSQTAPECSFVRCSNGIQDQNETGIDCGEVCNRTCVPELSAKILSISELLDGHNATIDATISELNNVSVTATAELRVDDSPVDTAIISLSGSSENISFYWIATGGTHNISVVADPLNEINETNESNNVDWTLVDVAVLPDLAIDESDIVWWI